MQTTQNLIDNRVLDGIIIKMKFGGPSRTSSINSDFLKRLKRVLTSLAAVVDTGSIVTYSTLELIEFELEEEFATAGKATSQ